METKDLMVTELMHTLYMLEVCHHGFKVYWAAFKQCHVQVSQTWLQHLQVLLLPHLHSLPGWQQVSLLASRHLKKPAITFTHTGSLNMHAQTYCQCRCKATAGNLHHMNQWRVNLL